MAQTEKKKILKAGAVYTFANILLRGISFLTLPVFIRLLSPDEFGRFNVFISFESIIFMFSGFTLHASIKNAYYDYSSEDYDTYIKNIFYVDFLNSIIIGIIANIAVFFWKDLIDLDYVEVNLLTIAGLCTAITSVYGSKLIMEYKAGDYALMSFISTIAGISLSIFFIFTIFNFNHYFGRILGFVAGETVAAFYVLIRVFANGFKPINIEQWKYGLKISLPIIPHGLSQIILSSANRIMIKYFYNAVQAGIFSFTYTVSMLPQVLFQSVTSVWEPWFFERMSENNIDQIRSKSNYFCLFISSVYVMIACVTPELIKILATKEYYEAIDISIIVLLGCYFATLYNIPCEVEYYYKKTKHIATSTFICALVNVGLNFLLMQYYSYKVAAYVTLFAYFLYFLFHMYMSYQIRKDWIFDIKTMSFTIISSMIIMFILLLLINYFILRFIILLIIFVTIMSKCKFVIQTIKEIKR